MSSPDPIGAALDAARLALESVTPPEATVTAKVNQDLALSSIANLERSIRFLSWEKERQVRVTAQRQARAEVDQALPKPVAAATPAPNKRK
jgi:hypothetical protein